MKLLLTKQDIENRLSISVHRKEEDVNKLIQEVQLFDLKPLVCEPFFNDLTLGSTDYSKLLQGGSYLHEGKNVYFSGLKSVLSYFFYARYIFKSHQVDTPFGFVQKRNEHSEPISATEKRDMQKLYLQDAFLLWEDVKTYLNRNKEKYTIWSDCQNDKCTPKSKNKRLKFNVI